MTTTYAATPVARGRAWYAVGVLMAAYIFSIMDRQILTLLVGPIQKSLDVNDTMMGLLHGFTFAAFYAVMGLPIARLIDRGDRRLVIAVGVAVWSLATAASGLATDYWHLLLARIVVAAGEAVLLPGAVSLLADLFTQEQRGRAMGAFGAAGPVGSGAGLLAGGLILGAYTLTQPVWPLLGALQPWQATFVAVGLPGLLVALLVLGIPEPRRARKAASAAAPLVNVPISEVWKYLARNGRTMRAFIVGVGFFYVIVYGVGAWAPTYFARHFGWSYQQIGGVYGLLLLIAGPAGALAATWLGDRQIRRGVAHGYLRVAVWAVVGITLSCGAMVLSPSPVLAAACLGGTAFFSFFLFGAGPAIIAQITPAPMRGQIAALYTGGLNLLGAGCGPVLMGLVTDYVLRDRAAIGVSMLAVAAIAGVIAVWLIRSGFRSYADSVQQAASWRSAPVTAARRDAGITTVSLG